MATVLHSLGRWLRLKKYQIEVTFAVYMFTPTEKFAFWSIVFLLFSLTFIATILYLPQHIVFLIHRAWFYINGDDSGAERVLSGVAFANKARDTIQTTVSGALTSATVGKGAGSVVREL